MLKNGLEIDNFNAALRLYTCTHDVYSLFNDIYYSKCALAEVLLPSELPLLSEILGQFYFRVCGNQVDQVCHVSMAAEMAAEMAATLLPMHIYCNICH